MSTNSMLAYRCEAWRPDDLANQLFQIKQSDPNFGPFFSIEIYIQEAIDSPTTYAGLFQVPQSYNNIDYPGNFLHSKIASKLSEMPLVPRILHGAVIQKIMEIASSVVVGEIFEIPIVVNIIPESRSFRLAIEAIETVKVDGSLEPCAICREEMLAGSEAGELPCQHIYHQGCIEKWFRQSNSCPLCRRTVP